MGLHSKLLDYYKVVHNHQSQTMKIELNTTVRIILENGLIHQSKVIDSYIQHYQVHYKLIDLSTDKVFNRSEKQIFGYVRIINQLMNIFPNIIITRLHSIYILEQNGFKCSYCQNHSKVLSKMNIGYCDNFKKEVDLDYICSSFIPRSNYISFNNWKNLIVKLNKRNYK
jgi:hypothetical protein